MLVMYSHYDTKRKWNRLRIFAFAAAVLLVVGGVFFLKSQSSKEAASTLPTSDISAVEGSNTTNDLTDVPASKEQPVDQQQSWPVNYSLEEAASLTVVVNKKHRLPSDYIPPLTSVAGGQLRPEAASALQKLLGAAETAGAPMVIVSSYRSYQTQVSTYQYWVNTQGQEQADRESARPGHSEHQTGLTADMGNPDGSCQLIGCFANTFAGQWLAAHAHEYGFIIRYPDGMESETGYIYEPWHIRYVGVDNATAIFNSGQTMDQYYGVLAGDYDH